MSTAQRVPVLALTLAWLLAPATVRADKLFSPPEVMAAADGSFTFDVTFVKGPGTARFGGYDWLGDENIQGGSIGDGFCVNSVDPGWQFQFTVSGRLKNPALPGQVFQGVSFCGAPSSSATTSIRVFNPLSVGGPTAGREARLWNDPNPFMARTTFHYDLPEAGPVSLGIYDLAGRLVARVVEGDMSAGAHEIAWDRNSLRDVRANSGVLFARLSFRGRVQMRRMVLLM